MLSFLAAIYILLVLPPVLYLLVISLMGIRTPAPSTAEPVTGRIGVLIPAHNEKLSIVRTIESVQAAAKHSEPIDIHVIADNCHDNTAELARTANANVLERHNKHLRGKGAALQWAMQQLADQDYDYFIIIDADSIVNNEFFQEIRLALNEPNTEVVQTRGEALQNEHSSVKRLAMLGFNVLRARGRNALGGSAGIGNGFVVSKAALEQVPFRANSIVEDLEYHMRLVEADVHVRFCDSARIYSEMPVDDKASDIQSSRWEGGRLGVLKAAWLPLLIKSLKELPKGQWHGLNALLDLMLPPIGYMLFILLVGLLFPYTQSVALLGFFAIGVYVIGAALCGNGWSELSVLKKVPVFLFKKLLRIPALIKASSNSSSWNRTPRDKEK